MVHQSSVEVRQSSSAPVVEPNRAACVNEYVDGFVANDTRSCLASRLVVEPNQGSIAVREYCLAAKPNLSVCIGSSHNRGNKNNSITSASASFNEPATKEEETPHVSDYYPSDMPERVASAAANAISRTDDSFTFSEVDFNPKAKLVLRPRQLSDVNKDVSGTFFTMIRGHESTIRS